MTLIELAGRIEAYDPASSADNRADELAMHQDIVLTTGEGSMSPAFEATFLRSIDAAMTLAEGRGGQITFYKDGTAKVFLWQPYPLAIEAKAATPALALCAASLRARATMENASG
jgi:hypothetical protein